MAISLASVPLLVKNDLVSLPPGVSDAIFFASAACGSVGNTVETCCRVSIWRCSSALTWGLQWPTLTVTMPPKKSRYWLPSASQTYWSRARATTSGSL